MSEFYFCYRAEKLDNGTYYLEHGSNLKINAKDKNQAIKIFKIQEMFPEQYVDNSFVESREYNSDSEGLESKYDVTFIEGAEPKIYVYERKRTRILKRHHFRREDLQLEKEDTYLYFRVGEISLEECINVDFKEILPQPKGLLMGDIYDEQELGDKQLPVIGSIRKLGFATKREVRSMLIGIREKRIELMRMKNQLSESANLIRKELEQKYKLLFVLEIFTGMKEDVIGLLSGQNAPEDEPLHIYQMKAFMDEELGVYAEEGGLDGSNLEDFDDWIIKNYKNYLYKNKSVMVWQIRRNDKQYHDNPFFNKLINEHLGNFNTYFLFRNGDNLFRIWIDINIPETLIPKTSDVESLEDWIKSHQSYLSQKDIEKKLQENRESYAYGLLAIQGLIERTDLLGKSLRDVNLLQGKLKDKVKIIYDAEPKYWLSDSKFETWKEFISRNRNSISQGSRIVICDFDSSISYVDKNTRYEKDIRHYPYNPSIPVKDDDILIVEEFNEDSFESVHYHLSNFQIKCFIKSDEYKNRIPLYLAKFEVLNIDEITLEEIEYYKHSRLYRREYLEVQKVLSRIKEVKLAEIEEEKNFVTLLHNKFTHLPISVIEETISWWKLKNKWKRGVSSDDKKAYRMIVKELEKK